MVFMCRDTVPKCIPLSPTFCPAFPLSGLPNVSITLIGVVDTYDFR